MGTVNGVADSSTGVVPPTDSATSDERGEPRRRRRLAAKVVASVVVVLAIVVVIPLWAFGPPTWFPENLVPPFLERSPGPTVALVPSQGWSDDGPTAATEAPAVVPESGTMLLARSNGKDPLSSVAYLTVVEQPLREPDEPFDVEKATSPVAVGGYSGFVGVDRYSGHRWLTAGDESRHVTIWAGQDVTESELVDLGANLDLASPVARQKLDGGWQPVTSMSEALDGAHVRVVSQSTSTPEAHVQVTTRVGVGEDAMWLLGSTTVSDRVEVRGRQGLLTGTDAESPLTLTWTEEPGIVVQVTYLSDPSTRAADPLAEALQIANGLRPVDQKAWEEFAEEADTWEQTVEPDPEDLPPEPEVVLAGGLGDGRQFRIEERNDARLCVVVDGRLPLDRCDTQPGSGKGGTSAELPRLVDPGDITDQRSPVLVYGYLPERTLTGDMGEVQAALGPAIPVGQAVEVHVADARGRPQGTAVIEGDAWALHIPDVAMGLVVTYRFADGTTLEVEPATGEDNAPA